MSKYEPLWMYIKNEDLPLLTLTFEEVENITKIPLDHSFLHYKKELISYGFQIMKISMKEKYIVIQKVSK